MANFLDKLEEQLEAENSIDKLKAIAKHTERVKIINSLLDDKVEICSKDFITLQEKAVVDYIDKFINEKLGGLKQYLD